MSQNVSNDFKIKIINNSIYPVYATLYYGIYMPADFENATQSAHGFWSYNDMNAGITRVFDNSIFSYSFGHDDEDEITYAHLSVKKDSTENPNYDGDFANSPVAAAVGMTDAEFFFIKDLYLGVRESKEYNLSLIYNTQPFWNIIEALPRGTVIEVICPISVSAFGSSSPLFA